MNLGGSIGTVTHDTVVGKMVSLFNRMKKLFPFYGRFKLLITLLESTKMPLGVVQSPFYPIQQSHYNITQKFENAIRSCSKPFFPDSTITL